MKKNILFLLLAIIALICPAQKIGDSAINNKNKSVFLASPVSLNNDNTDGVSRIGVNIQGLPHSSSRIDDAILFVKGVPFHATDIDGVDFKRYFQWEDDGIIYIELDFPKQKNISPGDSIRFITVNGVHSVRIGRASK